MAFHDALDLEYWLVNVLSGANQNIFTFVAFIAIASMAAYFRMLNSTTFLFFVLFAVLMMNYLQGVYFLLILLAGIITAYYVSRILSKS